MKIWSMLCVALVGLCAIDWYGPDGGRLNEGAYLYTPEQAEIFAQMQAVDYPGYTYQIRCTE